VPRIESPDPFSAKLLCENRFAAIRQVKHRLERAKHDEFYRNRVGLDHSLVNAKCCELSDGVVSTALRSSGAAGSRIGRLPPATGDASLS